MSQKRFVTRRECAAALEISRQRVEQLIKRGDFKETAGGIDIVAARRTHAALKQLDKAALAAKARPAQPSKVTPAADAGDGDGLQLFDFAEARAKKENWNAARAEAEYKKMMGILIPRDEVAAKEFAVARKLRDRIIGFPARLSNFLPPEAMRMLTDECNQLVRELQEDAATIAESGAAA